MVCSCSSLSLSLSFLHGSPKELISLSSSEVAGETSGTFQFSNISSCSSERGQPFCINHAYTSKCPPSAATHAHALLFHGHPFARIHCSISRCPPHAAFMHACSSRGGQPFAHNHFNTSRCPPSAAYVHVSPSHGQPFARAHFSTSRCPPNTALPHVKSLHGQPFARAHFSSSSCPPLAASAQRQFLQNAEFSCGSIRGLRRRSKRFTEAKHPIFAASNISTSSVLCPVAATASRIAGLTTQSRASSAGSSPKFSDLRACVTTMSSRRPGMASCVSPSRRVGLHASISIPHAALEDILVGVSSFECALRCGFEMRSFSADLFFCSFFSQVVPSLCVQSAQCVMLRRNIAFFAPCSVQLKVLQISWRVWFAAVFAVSQLRTRGGESQVVVEGFLEGPETRLVLT
jgi:hypothetical protein